MNSKLPEVVLHTIATQPLFLEVLDKCLHEEEFLSNFERLTGVKRPPQRLDPVEMMVDKVTGFRDDQWAEFFTAFIPFVHRCVWLTWEGRFQGKTA
ncbi:TPA: hypothetical protein ACP41P_001567 [Klebsiella quasipneumoniae]|uniref:hypothetical protein n=1 Tax=Klebsiella michiganensis TaxID=1134687 RepID=UPI002FEF7264